MKNIFSFILLISFSIHLSAQKLEKLWETDTIFRIPESVLYDVAEKMLYVSNIDGASGAKDGKGHISKIGTDGKTINMHWVKGLHAPKGMAVFGNMLYVADVDAIIGIEKSTGTIKSTTHVPGAKFLNDLTVAPSGTLYFSDSETGIIHKMEAGSEAEILISGRTRPNGVLFFDGLLYFADAGALFVRNSEGSISEIAKGMERSTDGIEPVDGANFLISAWIGEIYLVNLNGKVTTLLSTKDEKINSADIGYDRLNRIMYVPTFNSNRVLAYKLVL
jgi:DNA-binding beta-propeller fold protein YncE